MARAEGWGRGGSKSPVFFGYAPFGCAQGRQDKFRPAQDTLNEFGASRRQGSVWRWVWLEILILLRVGRGEGGAYGPAPGIRAEGVDVFVLGDLDGLNQGLAEIGESGGGSGFDVTLGDGGEKACQGGTEIAGGEKIAEEERRYILAGLLGGKGLRFLARMWAVPETQMEPLGLRTRWAAASQVVLNS